MSHNARLRLRPFVAALLAAMAMAAISVMTALADGGGPPMPR
jgi:hypothetical protein